MGPGQVGLDGRVASLVLVDVASVLAAELATHGRCRYIGGRALIGRCGSQWLYTPGATIPQRVHV